MTEQEFYQKLLAELEKAADADKHLSALLEKIQSGQADFADSAAYWQKFSALIGSVLSQNAAAPGSGLNEEVSYLMLKNGHMRAFEIMSMVQKALDEKQNLHIEPQKPKFPDERARHAAHSLEDTTVSEEVIRRRAENAIANIANTFHDDYVQENAKFRNNAGLKTYITRTTTGKCCAWCTQIAGRYEYGRHPADVFRRHDNCDCTVTYENGRQRTNVWTKKSWNAPVISPDALNFQPARFTPEQARETERKNLQYRGLNTNNILPLKGSSEIKFDRLNNSSKMDKKFANELRTEYDKFTSLFGELFSLRGINIDEYQNDRVFGYFTPSSAEITLCGIGGKDGRNYISKIASEHKKSGEWSTGSEFHTMRHELGHALQHELQQNDEQWSLKLSKIQSIKDSLEKELTNLEDSAKIEFKKNKLSKYGFDNIDEFISECIAEYVNSPKKARSTAKKVAEILLGKDE